MNNAKMCNYILHGSVWKMSMLQATGSKNALSENGFESGDAHPAYASQCAWMQHGVVYMQCMFQSKCIVCSGSRSFNRTVMRLQGCDIQGRINMEIHLPCTYPHLVLNALIHPNPSKSICFCWSEIYSEQLDSLSASLVY